MPRGIGQGLRRGRGQGRGGNVGRGRGLGGGTAQGPEGECVCPSCGFSKQHRLGIPCFVQQCPKCGEIMTRGV